MTESPLRAVRLWHPDIRWDRRDGSWVIWQNDPLGDYPARLSDRIRHWAARIPDVTWMAERDAGGDWQRVSYADLLRHIRAIGQALLDMGLGVDRPLVILSGNSIAHGLVALGAQFVGIPSAAIAPAYALASEEYGKLTSVRDQITPGAVFVEDTAPFARAIAAVFPDLPVLARHGAATTAWDRLLATPAHGRGRCGQPRHRPRHGGQVPVHLRHHRVAQGGDPDPAHDVRQHGTGRRLLRLPARHAAGHP